MAQNYNLKKIHTLLTEVFTHEELCCLCYDDPDFISVYNQLTQGTSKAEIIDRLIKRCEQKLQIEKLLTLARAHNPLVYEQHQPYYQPATSTITLSNSVNGESQRTTILLADNDPDFLSIVQEFLERNGYRVIAVSDPAEARNIVSLEPVALAVLDFRLADDRDDRDKSGLNLARDITWASSVPKIILTRFDQYEYARDSLRPGSRGKTPVVDFVTKQEGLDALLISIQNVLVETKIFLCYARPDESTVGQLYDKLCRVGFTPWMDKKCIVGGEKWENAIHRAIRETDFFVVCISHRSVNRRGFMQKEIRMALSIWEEMLEDDIYLIPVRLETCKVNHEKLRELQWIDMFHQNGFQKLIQAIRTGMKRRV